MYISGFEIFDTGKQINSKWNIRMTLGEYSIEARVGHQKTNHSTPTFGFSLDNKLVLCIRPEIDLLQAG